MNEWLEQYGIWAAALVGVAGLFVPYLLFSSVAAVFAVGLPLFLVACYVALRYAPRR